jgi:hypothetical protein
MMPIGNIERNPSPSSRSGTMRGPFTRIYQRTNKHDAAVLYGAIVGSVVYVGSELSALLRGDGFRGPAFALGGAASAAIVIGLTVLRERETGESNA